MIFFLIQYYPPAYPPSVDPYEMHTGEITFFSQLIKIKCETDVVQLQQYTASNIHALNHKVFR